MTNIENIPIFKNGRATEYENGDETETIKTYNTCAFDSIFSTYACLYFDDASFRSYLDVSSSLFHSKFTELVDLYFATITSTHTLKHSSKEWKALYDDRNKILQEIFSSEYYARSPNLLQYDNITVINCKTGLGEFFVQLSNKSEIIASAIESKMS